MRRRQIAAEVFGTFWLVLGGCGTAVLHGAEAGRVAVALAFGLTVLTMVYAVGHISGGHFNPAVTIGLVIAGWFRREDALPYIGAQVVGAILGAVVIAAIATGVDGFSFSDGFAANGWGEQSPGRYSFLAVVVAEVVLTAFFVIVILGATATRAFRAVGGVAIGLALTLIHLISIPVSNTSVNPARSTSQAIFAGGEYLIQLPVFWIAPMLGAVLGGLAWIVLLEDPADRGPTEVERAGAG